MLQRDLMQILELVFQGVRGSPNLLRIPIGAGATVLVPGGEGRIPMGELLQYLLYSEGGEVPAGLALQDVEASRAAVTLQGRDGQAYQIVRDLRNGGVQLLRWDAAANQYAVVSTRPSEATQYLRSQAGIPGGDVFSDILALGKQDLPSLRPAEVAAPAKAEAASPGGHGGHGAHGGHGGPPKPEKSMKGPKSGEIEAAMAREFMGLSLDGKRKKRAEIDALLQEIARIDALQFELDGVQQDLYDFDKVLHRLRQYESEVARVEEEAGQISGLEGLPEGFEAQARGYAFLVEKLNQTMSRIEGERRTLTGRAPLAPEPPFKHPAVLGGVLGAVAVTGAAFSLDGLRLLLLANPLLLGAAAFFIYKWLGDLEHSEAVGGAQEGLREREEQAQRGFEMETALVRKVLHQRGLKDPGEILKLYDARKVVLARADGARAKLAEESQRPEFKAAYEGRAKLAPRVADLEQQLRDSGGYSANPGDLRRQAEILDQMIAREERGETAWVPETPQAVVAGGNTWDPGPALINRLSETLRVDGAAAAEQIAGRLAQYLAALTQQAWVDASFDQKGHIALVPSGSAGRVAWAGVASPDQDLIFLALRLAFAEAVVRAEPRPLFFFDAFPDLDDERKGLLHKMVTFLAGQTQLVIETRDPFWYQGASAVYATS